MKATRAKTRVQSKMLSTSEVAKALGVAQNTVVNWIDQDKLKAGKTPGGHRRIRLNDVLDFARAHSLTVDAEMLPDGPKLLIVNDEPVVVGWLTEKLEGRFPGWEVLQASDGFTAGMIVGSCKLQVVLLDLGMEGMDGFEVCRRIKADPKTRDVAVLAMTAYYSQASEERVREVGAEALLVKPLDPDHLARILEEAMGRPMEDPTSKQPVEIV